MREREGRSEGGRNGGREGVRVGRNRCRASNGYKHMKRGRMRRWWLTDLLLALLLGPARRLKVNHNNIRQELAYKEVYTCNSLL